MHQALKPSHFNVLDVPSLRQEEEGERLGDETRALAQLKDHKGWGYLNDYMGRIIDDLDQMTVSQMQQGVSVEEIGKTTVIKEIIKDALRRIRNRVNDSAQSVRNASERGEGLE